MSTCAGTLVKTNKSSLLHAIEARVGLSCAEEIPANSTLIIDGMALIQALNNIPATFGELANTILDQVIKLALKYRCSRVDFVTDRYPVISIKNLERSRRAAAGTQIFHIYGKEQKTPKQWKKLLADGNNKDILIEFLFGAWKDASLSSVNRDIDIYIAHAAECHLMRLQRGVVTLTVVDELACDHEEADNRMLLHAKHAEKTSRSVVIRSPDTDVAIIAISIKCQLAADCYFLTGTKDKVRIIDMQKITAALESKLSAALIGLHVFTGCDTTSAFYGKGKRKALDIASKSPEFLDAFCALGSSFTLCQSTVAVLEEFVCKLYGQISKDINETRYKLFCISSPSEQNLPPTKDVLREHCKRCNYQAAIHRKCFEQYISAPSPTDQGWKMEDGKLVLNWSTMGQVPAELLKFIHCGCRTGNCDKGRCSCLDDKLPCTDYCKCSTTMCKNRCITKADKDYSDNSDDGSDSSDSESSESFSDIHL